MIILGEKILHVLLLLMNHFVDVFHLPYVFFEQRNGLHFIGMFHDYTKKIIINKE